MTAFLVMRIAITDEVRWRAYREAVVPLIARFGGRHVTGGGRAERLESGDGGLIAMFEFPSMEAVRAFWHSPDYAPVKEMRRGAATLEAWAVPGNGREGKPMKEEASETPLSAPQLAELEALAALPDDQINTAATPDQKDWHGARRGVFFRR